MSYISDSSHMIYSSARDELLIQLITTYITDYQHVKSLCDE